MQESHAYDIYFISIGAKGPRHVGGARPGFDGGGAAAEHADRGGGCCGGGLHGRPNCQIYCLSRANRVSEKAVAALLGEPLAKADADFVRTRTGFVIGGVPPLGHVEPPVTFIDEDLLTYSEIWAAAGTPNAVFRLAPSDLLALTSGKVAKVKA
jgi:hypothetical protein